MGEPFPSSSFKSQFNLITGLDIRFVANGMCGRLCRWLRLLGYDVKYAKNAPDEAVINAAREGDRILLTSDDELYRKARSRDVRSLLIKEVDEARQLALVARELGVDLHVDEALSRCPLCNSRIKPIGPDDVEGRVPESTLRSYRDFWICLGCGKVYWHGSHWRNIERVLAEANKIRSEEG